MREIGAVPIAALLVTMMITPGNAVDNLLSRHFGTSAEVVELASLPGWSDDDHSSALEAFAKSCNPPRHPKAGDLRRQISLALAGICGRMATAGQTAREFFETNFTAVRIGRSTMSGFLTGYYEPELAASRVKTDRFTAPLYRRPKDLIAAKHAELPPGWDEDLAFGRYENSRLIPYHDRRAIDEGALADRNLELAYLDGPVEVLFAQIQGSARLRLANGSMLRIAYDGKSGHPYTAIGRILVDRGEIGRDALTAATLRAWLEANPKSARGVIWRNRSYVFFREVDDIPPDAGPVGAAGVSLTAGRSLAVDRSLHAFGSPVWIDSELPFSHTAGGTRFRRLMIAQDTGSAIVGPARGDIFFGSGSDSGRLAGVVKHPGAFVLLIPNAVARDWLGGSNSGK